MATEILDKIINDDFVWKEIVGNLPIKRQTQNNYLTMNCPMCTFRGESKDTRHRCGVKKTSNGLFIHCFNCGFSTSYERGHSIKKDLRQFMQQIGINETKIQEIAYKSFQYSQFIKNANEKHEHKIEAFNPQFKEYPLPEKSKTFQELADMDDPPQDFMDAVEYLYSRGEVIFNSATYYWSPEHKRRIILPCYFKNKIVGWVGRTIDKSSETNIKYYKETPPDYIYNNHYLYDSKQKYIIVVEGQFDADSINGVALLGSSLNKNQAEWLKSTGKKIIILGDADKAGQKMIDGAIEHGFYVSFPRLQEGHGVDNWWESKIKDAADAAQHYGKLYTIRSILETATNNKLDISIKRAML